MTRALTETGGGACFLRVWGASTTAVSDTCAATVVAVPLVLNSKNAV